MLPIFFLPIVFALIPLHKRHKKNILLAFISGLFVASVYCFGNFVYQILSDSQFAQNFYSQPLGQLYSTFYIFDHTSYYSAYLVFSIIVIFKFFCDNTFPKFKKQIRFAGIFLVIVFALLTFLISSRAGLIGLVVLSFVLAYQNFKNIYIRVVLFSLLIFVSVMVFTNTRFIKTLGVFESVLEQEEFDKKTISKHSALRLVLWEASFDVIEENLFTGVGTGDVRDELWHKVVDDYGFELDKEFNPHNQFLSTFMATGIVGFLALLGIFVFGFMESFRKQNLFLLNLLILLFIHFQFETMMGRLNGILFFSFFLSILFYYNRKYADDSLIYF
ncbi:MAG: O-antigen ligase family protein [Bacteroidales bacterium]